MQITLATLCVCSECVRFKCRFASLTTLDPALRRSRATLYRQYATHAMLLVRAALATGRGRVCVLERSNKTGTIVLNVVALNVHITKFHRINIKQSVIQTQLVLSRAEPSLHRPPPPASRL